MNLFSNRPQSQNWHWKEELDRLMGTRFLKAVSAVGLPFPPARELKVVPAHFGLAVVDKDIQ